MSAIGRLRADAFGETTVTLSDGSPIGVRYRRVTTDSVLSAGMAHLFLQLPKEVLEGAAGLPEDAAQQLMMAQLQAMDPEKLAQVVNETAKDGSRLICAGVVELAEDGQKWEAVQIVLEACDEDTNASPPRLHLDIFTPEHRAHLEQSIRAHSGAGEGKAGKAARFRPVAAGGA